MLFVSLVGRMIDQYGQDHAHASHSARQEGIDSKKMNDIYGRYGESLWRTAHLQSFVASKLRVRQGVCGCPEYDLIFIQWAMPLGPPICALRARVPRMPDPDYSGWPTPVASQIICLREICKTRQARQKREGRISICQATPNLPGLAFELKRVEMNGSFTSIRKGQKDAFNVALSRWLMGYPEGWDRLSPNFKAWLEMQGRMSKADGKDMVMR